VEYLNSERCLIACRIGDGNNERFVELMRRRAHELGIEVPPEVEPVFSELTRTVCLPWRRNPSLPDTAPHLLVRLSTPINMRILTTDTEFAQALLDLRFMVSCVTAMIIVIVKGHLGRPCQKMKKFTAQLRNTVNMPQPRHVVEG
jgi:hypothetical protein